MLHFSRLKTALIFGVCILGALLCLPNLFPAPAPWLPWRQVHLGLDLRGGSYLLLEVDMAAIRKERLDAIVDSARQALSGKYRNLVEQAPQQRVLVSLRDPSQAGRRGGRTAQAGRGHVPARLRRGGAAGRPGPP